MTHRGDDALFGFLRAQQAQTCLARQFKVHAHAIRKMPKPIDKLRRGSRHGLRMDISTKPVMIAQQLQRTNHKLGGMVGRTDDARAEEQPFDIVTAIKRHSKIGQLFRRERRTRHFVAATINAIRAIVHAYVGHEHFEQRDATPIGRKAMAASSAERVADITGLRAALQPRRCTGDIVFRRIGKDLQLLLHIHGSPSANIRTCYKQLLYSYACSWSRTFVRYHLGTPVKSNAGMKLS